MVDSTRDCIRESMMSLLEKKEYSKIQMKEIAENAHVGRKTLYRYFDSKEAIVVYIAESLMDRFAVQIAAQKQMTLPTVTYAFFTFVHKNRDEFLLLKKAKLLSYIEDNLMNLVAGIAGKTKYEGKTAEEVLEIKKAEPIEDKYALSYILAGNWRMAMIWIEEDPFISPKQLTEIAVKIMRGM